MAPRKQARQRRFTPIVRSTARNVSKVRRLRTVVQFHQEHDEFSQSALRWLIFRAQDNGLQQAGAVVRVGRRVYLDPERFFAWIELQQPVDTRSGGGESGAPATA